MMAWQQAAKPRHGPWLLACAALACSDAGEGGAARARPVYTALSETGLYTDLAARELAGNVRPYAPAFSLWADGADKARWVALPPGAQIETTDMDHWRFPVGTRFWKEFSLHGVPLETRLIERYGEGPNDYWLGAFVWRADQSDAELREQGAADVLGTRHDAPSQEQCLSCHRGEPGRILGFSALQLAASAASEELDLAQLVAEAWLSAPPAAATREPPGDALTQAALGYLHANCGNCHSAHGSAWPDTQLLLRLSFAERTAAETGLLQSVVNQPLQYFRDGKRRQRVVPGVPEQSALLARMELRGPREQMPPIASERADADGVELVRRWIASLAASFAVAPATGSPP